jgi:hypothetical protein
MSVNIKELPYRIAETIKDHPVGAGMGLSLIFLGVVESPYLIHGGLTWLNHIASGLLAMPTWDIPTEQGLTEMLRSSEGVREVARWAAIDSLLGGVIFKGLKDVGEVIKGKKGERMLAGIEPVDKKENPKHIFIGPSGMISDLAENLEKDKRSKNAPIVGIHVDDKIPPVWGQEMKYHFKLNDPNELIGRFPPSIKSMSFIEATGLDRAEEITIACINPDNALFYGQEAQSGIPPTFVSTLLRKFPKDQLKGKKINVIYNEENELAGTSAIAKELEGLAKEMGFKLKLVTPEQLFINKLTKDLEDISKQKKEDEPIYVTIVGQGRTDVDTEMLLNFKKVVSSIGSSNIKQKIEVSLLRRNFLDNFTGDFESKLGEKVTEVQMREKVKESLANSDYILVYGDHDHGTSSLTRLLLFDYEINKDKIQAIAERLNNLFDFVDVGKVSLIYQMIIDEMKEIKKEK